jgi:hypothetical protein
MTPCKVYKIHPVSTQLASGAWDITLHILDFQDRFVGDLRTPLFEETFQTKEEAIEFGVIAGKKFIDEKR